MSVLHSVVARRSKLALAVYQGEHTPFDPVDDGFDNGSSVRVLKAFEKDHPEFIEQLKDRGLNEEEIRFCCLEVLGIDNHTK